MTFLRFFIRYLYLGMTLDSAWRIARNSTQAQRRWHKMWTKPFARPERLG